MRGNVAGGSHSRARLSVKSIHHNPLLLPVEATPCTLGKVEISTLISSAAHTDSTRLRVPAPAPLTHPCVDTSWPRETLRCHDGLGKVFPEEDSGEASDKASHVPRY